MKKLFDEIPRLEGERLVLDRVTEADAGALGEMVADDEVYRFLPTYLFERQFDDVRDDIRGLYGDLFADRKSLILGIRLKEGSALCGLAEFYGLRDDVHKISVGYRLLRRYWGRGIATEGLGLMVGYLHGQTDTQIITASTMVQNAASARVLEKNGFTRTARSVEEDWGYDSPTIADKWFC